MKTEIFKTIEDFLKREDKDVNGVSEEFAKENPDYEKKNETNKACWNCSRCSDCSDCCSDCYGCYGCYGCYRCYGLRFKYGIKDEKAEEVTKEQSSEIKTK